METALIQARVAKYDGHAGMVTPRDCVLVQVSAEAEHVLRLVFGAQLRAHADLSPDGTFLTLYPADDGFRFSTNNSWLQWQYAGRETGSFPGKISPPFGLTSVVAELCGTHLRVPLPLIADRRPPHRINGRGQPKRRLLSPAPARPALDAETMISIAHRRETVMAAPRFGVTSEIVNRDDNGDPTGGHSQLVIVQPEPPPSPSGEVMVTLGNATFCGSAPVTVIARLIHQYNLRA